MLNEEKREGILKLYENGMGITLISKEVGVDPKTVRKYVKESDLVSSVEDGRSSRLVEVADKLDENENKGSRGEGEVYAEVFKLLDEGVSLVEVVEKLCLPPGEVREIFYEWEELKSLEFNEPTVLDRLKEVEDEIEALKEVIEKGFKEVMMPRLDSLELGLDRLRNRVIENPLAKLRNCACSRCKNRGGMAVCVVCVECGLEGYFGSVNKCKKAVKGFLP